MELLENKLFNPKDWLPFHMGSYFMIKRDLPETTKASYYALANGAYMTATTILGLKGIEALLQNPITN